MSIEKVESLRKIALRIVWELQTGGGNHLAESVKDHRMARIEAALKELRARADKPDTPNDEKKAAMEAIAEVLTALSQNIDTLSNEASAIVKGMC